MCLQDYQLARAANVVITPYSSSGVSTVQVLPKNDARVGLLFLGPSGGTIQIHMGATGQQNMITTFTSGSGSSVRSITLQEHGLVVIEPLWVYTSGVANLVIYEYLLPVDPENLQRLAAKGKW